MASSSPPPPSSPSPPRRRRRPSPSPPPAATPALEQPPRAPEPGATVVRDSASGAWTYASARHGVRFAFDAARRAWMPVVDAGQLALQQSAYGGGDDPDADTAPRAAAPSKRKTADTAGAVPPAAQRTAARSNPRGAASNAAPHTSVYVTGLPPDATVDEVAALFSKYAGVLMPGPDGVTPRVKLYMGADGVTPKGDALLTFYKRASVDLAITLLDDRPFREPADRDAPRMRVTEAEFKPKPSAEPPEAAAAAARRPPDAPRGLLGLSRAAQRQQKQKHLRALQNKLEWFDDSVPQLSQKAQRTVVLTGLFTLAELAADVTLLLDLQEDVREECARFGEVTSVIVFDREPRGVVMVRFREQPSADVCVACMRGRWFGGQRIGAAIWDGATRFRRTDGRSAEERALAAESARPGGAAASTPRGGPAPADGASDGDSDDEAARLEAFGAWLEQQGDSSDSDSGSDHR